MSICGYNIQNAFIANNHSFILNFHNKDCFSLEFLSKLFVVALSQYNMFDNIKGFRLAKFPALLFILLQTYIKIYDMSKMLCFYIPKNTFSNDKS